MIRLVSSGTPRVRKERGYYITTLGDGCELISRDLPDIQRKGDRTITYLDTVEKERRFNKVPEQALQYVHIYHKEGGLYEVEWEWYEVVLP